MTPPLQVRGTRLSIYASGTPSVNRVVLGDPHQIVGLDATTGKQVWRAALRHPASVSGDEAPDVVLQNSDQVSVTWRGPRDKDPSVVTVFDTSNGHRRGTVVLAPLTNADAVVGDRLIAGNLNDVIGYSLRSGRELWRHAATFEFARPGLLLIVKDPTDDAVLQRIDPDTGRVGWSLRLKFNALADWFASAVGDIAYLTGDETLTAVSASTGKTLWRATTDQDITVNLIPVGQRAVALMSGIGAPTILIDTAARRVIAKATPPYKDKDAWGVEIDGTAYAVLVNGNGMATVLDASGVHATASVTGGAVACDHSGDTLLCAHGGMVTAYSVPSLGVRWSAPVPADVTSVRAVTPTSMSLIAPKVAVRLAS